MLKKRFSSPNELFRSGVAFAVPCAAKRRSFVHGRAARTNGLTPEEISEVLLHTAVYAGVPASNAAFAVAQRVLADE